MSHFRNTSNCFSNFRENNTQALVISERLKLPQDDRTDTNFMGLLRMHFQRSKSTLDSLKSVFNVFRRKQPLGAPGYSLTHFDTTNTRVRMRVALGTPTRSITSTKSRWFSAEQPDRPIRLTQCCTQFRSPGDKILCVLYLHYDVAFTFK